MRIGLVVTIVAGALSCVFAGRVIAREDPLARADAIYVFPGDIPARPLCAVDLWKHGRAASVVFTGGSLDRTLSALGEPVTDAEERRERITVMAERSRGRRATVADPGHPRGTIL